MLELAERTNRSNMSAMDSTGLSFLAGGEEGRSPAPLFLRIQLGMRLVVLERPLYPVIQCCIMYREVKCLEIPLFLLLTGVEDEPEADGAWLSDTVKSLPSTDWGNLLSSLESEETCCALQWHTIPHRNAK